MLEVLGIALVPIIVALVSLAKHFGLPHDKARWLNAGLSVLGVILVQAIEFRPDWGPEAKVVLESVIVFLSAAGFYREAVEKPKENEPT
jgi:drug/metabolite transporter (DMT)-like permease